MEDETKIVEENEVKEAEAKETEAKETQARDSSILKDTVEQGEAPENKKADNAAEETDAADDSEEENIGVVRVADDVVAMIASYSALEIDGVSAMSGGTTGDLFAKVGYKNPTKGVKVDVTDGVVKVDLAIIMDYGFNIPATSSKVQARVKQSIENMTGLEVDDVNVRIAGIKIPSDSSKAD